MGKTTACDRLVILRPDVRRYAASELLRAATRRSSEELRTASAGRIRDNQKLIRAELQRRLEPGVSGPVVIEAHSVIDNGTQLVAIPLAVVADLEPSRLVLLEAAPKVILRRRASQAEGRGVVRDPKQIGYHQDAALTQAQEYARELGLPLYRLRTDRSFNVLDIVGSARD